MFADPITVTIAGSAKSLPRVESNGKRSTYQNADSTVVLTISHSQTGRKAGGQGVRTMCRVDEKLVVVDPLTTESDYDTVSVYVVAERPEFGVTSTQMNDLKAALFAFLDSTAFGKLFGLES